MWKWLGGCAVLVVVLVICGAVWAHSKYVSFTAAGGATTVAIHAPAHRVFATLADGDSLSAWANETSTITTSRHGIFHVGDTLQAETASAGGARRETSTWTVTEVQADRLLVIELRTSQSAKVIATRRDSLVTSGDSTMVISTVASPAMDSVRSAAHDTGSAARSTVLDMGSKLLVSAFRFETELELKRLKAHVEGTPPAAKQ